MRRFPVRLLALVLTLAAVAAGADPTPSAMEARILQAFEAREHARAADLIESYLQRWPNSSSMLYNLACARSLLGERDAACSALLRAVEAGFQDFRHMEEDPDLESIRGEEIYRAILAAADRVETARAEDALARWRRTYGEEDYRYEIDEQRKLAFATALDEVAHAEMREMLSKEADHLIETLFGAPPAYFVLIAVPTPEHAHVLFGGDDAVGGKYEHDQRRLIARDIGGSLRHEFVHALHYGHMERLGLDRAHPIWIQEGLAALYEDYELDEDGIRFLPNDRHNIVRTRARSGRLAPWRELMAMTPDDFMLRAGWSYPQARSIFEFLADRGRLAEWYHAYIEHYEQDETGAKAFEIVFDQPLEDTERQWRRWVASRPALDTTVTYGDASLGIRGAVNGNTDGVLIRSFLPGSAARRALLRVGDVIVSVDGRPTRSMRELRAVIGAHRIGDQVVLRVRRDGEYRRFTVVLQELRPDAPR